MRLTRLETGHRALQKLALVLSHVFTVSEPLDILKILMYRPEYFGKPFCDLAHLLRCGPSDWSIGERELFGAFTSKLNHCVF